MQGAIALAGATIAIAIEASSLHADDKADQILIPLEALAERTRVEHEDIAHDETADTSRAG